MRNITITVFILLFSVSLCAQEAVNTGGGSAPAKPSRWFFEGTLSLSFGTVSHIGITPSVGYKVVPTFHTGATLSYYHGWDETYPENKTQSNLFGGSIFGRWVPIKEFFMQIEPAVYSYKVFNNTTTNEVKGVPFIFLGLGFNYYLNPKVFLTFLAKVDVLKSDDSPYKDEWHPFFNTGVGFSF